MASVEEVIHTVEKWMNSNLITIQKSMTIKDAMKIATEQNQTELPIIDNGSIMGVFRVHEVVNYLQEHSVMDDVTRIMSLNYRVLNDRILMRQVTDVPVYIINEDEKLIGSISDKELTYFQRFLIEELDKREESLRWYQLVFDTAYEGLTVVDENGIIRLFNQAYSRYTGVPKGKAVGMHAVNVIDNTRLPVVLKTGVPERSQPHNLQGQNVIVHRIPIWENNKIIGAAGILVYEGVSEIYQVIQRMEQLDVQKNQSPIAYKTVNEPEACVKFEDILGESPVISEPKKMARKAAKSQAAVLITGESGVGKEQFAKAIHYGCSTRHGNFISVNCAAIPDGLMESELFGYAKGAFTGADKDGKIGKFELAHNGTIFLDEIGDMPLAMQAKILRVLQEKKVERVGGHQSTPVNFRLITATNKDLPQLVRTGEFREDLFYRLYVIPLSIPPLRDRKEDIPIIVSHKLQALAKTYDVKEKTIDQKLLQMMHTYHWPGNIRELMNVLERLFVLTDGDHITFDELPELEQTNTASQEMQSYSPSHHNHLGRRKELLEEASKEEQELIERTLRKVQGNKSQAAKLLGMSRSTLYNKLSRYKKI
ncbi:sigma 54-interacting transcriptional regulator [Virgibacillus salexigens]|uniref:sigma 54-interacting transcriptional regulator n=1 Tax=Virgibacillus kapii TaxID=1638645 RepID=UPI00166CCA29|nr:sigma 54-interacting transcriptional regulator [Virgibacillus kapii]